MRISKTLLAGAALLAFTSPLLAQTGGQITPPKKEENKTTEVGRIEVIGAGEVLGSGYIVQEDQPKGRSTITRAGLNNILPTANPYQAIEILPGVSQNQDDPTGLFGGDLSMRGLKADQIGFTINGAPVNDSGNFAVFPQEYTDQENLDQIFITQGSSDVDAPHVGAVGGNIGIVSSQPLDYLNFRVAETVGQEQLLRHFLRFDTGWLGPVKIFASFSDSLANKWRGDGIADRQHTDGEIQVKVASNSKIRFIWLYNDATANFFRQMTKAQYQQFGRDFDYNTFWGKPGQAPIRLAPGPGPQNEAGSVADPENPGATALRRDFWPLQINPFRNVVLNLKGNFQITDDLRFDFEPYLWIGRGGGGFGRTEVEGASLGGTIGYTLPADLNGDGDSSDTVLLYRSSVTRTERPGFNTKLTYDWENFTFKLGAWWEQARHRQNQPYSYVDANGVPCDKWLLDLSPSNTCLVRNAAGIPIQGRDQFTVSTGRSIFGEISGDFFNDDLKVVVGLSHRQIKREVTALLPLSILTPGDPAFSPTAKFPFNKYDEFLPNFGVRYWITPEHQVFAGANRGFRVPANFVVLNYATGPLRQLVDRNIDSETSWDYEAGYRFQGEMIQVSVTGWLHDFKNYLATAQIDPVTRTTTNIGDLKIFGVEMEAGTQPWHGFTAYGSVTLMTSRLQDDFAASVTGSTINYLPTRGKQMTDTPNFMFTFSLGYENSGFFASLTPKCTSSRYSTLMNDQNTDAYCIFNATAGYKFDEGWGYLRGAKLQFFGQNIFDEDYLGRIAATGTSNALAQLATNGTLIAGGGGPNFVPGTPRFFGMQLVVDLGK
jgi:iron complex outermembrane receptor protein